MNAKRIIQIIPALTRGGAERVVVDLGNGLAERGHRVKTIVLWHAGDDSLHSMVSADVEVTVATSKKQSTFIRYFGGFWWLIRNLGEFRQADIVHVHLTQASLIGTSLYILRMIAKANYPQIVETYHAVGLPLGKTLRWFHRANMRFRDGLVLMADDSYWARFASSASYLKVATIPNGVSSNGCPAPQKRVDSFFRSLGLRSDMNTLIGTVSRAVPERRSLEVAEILIRVLHETGPETHAVWGGDGVLLGEIRRRVEASGVADRFHLLGAVDKPFTVMTSMSVYLTLSVGEIVGISGLEAASCGVPIVSLQLDRLHPSDSGSWIFSSHSKEEVARRVLEILDCRELATTVVAKQFGMVKKKFSSQQMVIEYEEVYEALGSSRR